MKTEESNNQIKKCSVTLKTAFISGGKDVGCVARVSICPTSRELRIQLKNNQLEVSNVLKAHGRKVSYQRRLVSDSPHRHLVGAIHKIC